MRRIFSGKNARGTEFAAESLINPSLSGIHLQKSGKVPSRPTVTEQQEKAPVTDDFSEKKGL